MRILEFNYDNVMAGVVSSKHGLTPADIKKLKNPIESALKDLKKTSGDKKDPAYSWLNLPHESPEKIIKFANTQKKKYKTIVIIGVGGPTVGAVSLTKSIRYDYWGNIYNPLERPIIHYVNNIDPEATSDLLEKIDFKNTLFIISSVSGNTPETIANFLIIREKLKNKCGKNFHKQFVVITNSVSGAILNIAKKENYHLFTISPNTCGRFSMLDVCGLLPTALAGIDIKPVLEGAKLAKKDIFSKSFENNFIAQLAAIQFLLNTEKAKGTTALMCYSRQLFNFSVWYRQLIAESLGKSRDLQDNPINSGPTPMSLLGTSDQHTQLQHIAEGPNNKFMLFLGAKNFSSDLVIPSIKNPIEGTEALNYIQNKKYKRLYHLYQFATQLTLAHNQRPNATITLKHLDAKTMGYLAFALQVEIAILGSLYNIQYMNHPTIEIVKNCTKAFLESNEF